MIFIGLRFDDPSPTSDQTLERAIIDALERHTCSATLAVIPFRRVDGGLLGLTKDSAAHLVDASARGTVEIALHGFSHAMQEIVAAGKPSEFAGRTSIEQLALIERGLRHLKSIFGDVVHGFVPPWNSFDADTLGVLEKLSFRYLSAGWEVPASYRGTVALLPLTCKLPSLKSAVQQARRLRFLSPLIIVVMHHYDFVESMEPEAVTNLRAFDELLGWLKGQSDLEVSTLGGIAAQLVAADWRRALARHRFQQSLPWRLRRALPEQHALYTGPWWGARRPRAASA